MWQNACASNLRKGYDAIVVGLGAMGSASLYHLAKQGLRCLGIEQFAPGHSFGSSHGDTRIIRLAYAEDPSYVPLLQRSFQLWSELEEVSNRKLLHVTGSIDVGEEDSFSFSGALRSAHEHRLEHTIMSGSEVNELFPGYSIPPHYKALYQPQGGFIESEAAIKTHVEAAMQSGAEVLVENGVRSWDVGADGRVRLDTDSHTVFAERVIFAGGAWMRKLVPQLQDCVPERQVVAWFAVEDEGAFRQERFPVFNLEACGGRWYGFPQFGSPGFKIGRYRHEGEVADADSLDRMIRESDIDLLWEGASRMFRGLSKTTLKASACMFTNTPDENFVMDIHPEHPQVAVCSACSGHGFKFSPVIGEIMASLAMKGVTDHDISIHRIAYRNQQNHSNCVWRH